MPLSTEDLCELKRVSARDTALRTFFDFQKHSRSTKGHSKSLSRSVPYNFAWLMVSGAAMTCLSLADTGNSSDGFISDTLIRTVNLICLSNINQKNNTQ
jgi:hypothetical protein